MTDEQHQRLGLVHRTTASTQPVPQLDDDPDNQSHTKSESGIDRGHEQVPPIHLRPTVRDFFLLFAIFVMLIWPWIFFSLVWAKKGIRMNNRVAKLVLNNPHVATYFSTFLCNIISTTVTALFSLAITRFSQELVTVHQPIRPFHARVLYALTHQTLFGILPGKGRNDVRYLMTKDRWLPTILVIVCVVIFPQLLANTTSLLIPTSFSRTESLSGTELDFSSTDPVCLDWFKANPLSNSCAWQPYNELNSSCFGPNQMVDVLEAGRANIFELGSNNSQRLTFSQLGVDNALHFLGPVRGVLPIGPNGVPAFQTLNPSPFSDPDIVAGMTSYNYVLNNQGLANNISCSYQPTSPIAYGSSSNDTVTYNVPSCNALGETSILTSVPSFTSALGKNTLMYWACQSPSPQNNTQVPSYSIYLRGSGSGYEQNVGNITCTVSATHPALFPATYQSTKGIFSVGAALSANAPVSASPSAYSLLINYTLMALGEVISDSQNLDSNLVAESVVTVGVNSFKLEPYVRNSKYLQLYEHMIQGILEYETTYIRLIYSRPSYPPSCIRAVTGFVEYELFGWFMTGVNISFLIAMTVVNGASVVALLLAVVLAKGGGYMSPSYSRKVTYDPDSDEVVPDEWRQRIAFNVFSHPLV